jgi:hypothetical protein
VTHVPLLVKLPGQVESVSVATRFETRELGSLMRWGLGPDAKASDIHAFMEERQRSAQGAKEAMTWNGHGPQGGGPRPGESPPDAGL